MSAEWDEVKRLAADFQRAQLSSSATSLSERNCIEIVKKLIELNLIEVTFTTDGKEYLTQPRLLKEIKDELLVHGGRINLVDLAQIIGVDYSHVEAKATEYLNHSSDTYMVLGQLITRNYLDTLAEEVNEKLQQVGEISFTEITKLYDLPGEFIEKALLSRLGTIIKGQVDSTDSQSIFTESYISQNTARIKGALAALMRPIPLSSVISYFKFPEKLFYSVAEKLVKEKLLAGTIAGGNSANSIYIPNIYAKSQGEWIDAFYKQNGYLEYDAVVRHGIMDAKSHLMKKFKDEQLLFLRTCCVGKTIFNQIEAIIEEALCSGTWADILSVLPSIFTPEDCHDMITTVSKTITKKGSIVHVYCDSFVVSDEFIKKAEASFQPLMTSKAQDDVTKYPDLLGAAQPNRNITGKKDSTSKGKQEEKKKRSTGGKSGGGTHGRETKMRNVKKKHIHQKEADEQDLEDDFPVKHTGIDLEFMDVNSIKNYLQKLDLFVDCPEELVLELASEMHRSLKKKYQEVVKSLFESSHASSSTARRKQHEEYVDKFTTILGHIIMFEKAFKFFSDDLSSQLLKHLQKTLCADLANSIFGYLSHEQGLPFTISEVTAETRQKMILKFPENLQSSLTKLNSSLNAKTLDDFHLAIETAFGPEGCDMIIKKPDKKKERLILQNHRHSLLKQINEVEESALCLHLATLLIFQSHTGTMLHASGKFVPYIITFLRKHIPNDTFHLLSDYQDSVIKKLSPNNDEEERQCTENHLIETMPKIKECAVMYKKTLTSEN